MGLQQASGSLKEIIEQNRTVDVTHELFCFGVFGAFDAQKNGDLSDLNWREMAVFTPLVALVFIIGLFPQIILQVTAPAAETALAYLSVGKSKVAIAASQEGATLAPTTVSQRPPKKLDVIRN